MPSISYAITACNEHVELDRLLSQLTEHIRPEDEIVVQMDITATEEVKAVVNKYKLMNYFHPLILLIEIHQHQSEVYNL